MIRIRQFGWADYDAVVALWTAAGREPLSRAELVAKLARDPELFLVAVAGEDPAGEDPAGGDLAVQVAAVQVPADERPTGEGLAVKDPAGGDSVGGVWASAGGCGGPTGGAGSVAGVVVGVVLGTYDGRRGWILRLAVPPARRRAGIATRLVDELERRFRGLGCPRVNLLVMPDNAAGLRFWQALGYLPVPDVLCTKPM